MIAKAQIKAETKAGDRLVALHKGLKATNRSRRRK
jgi:hypothetical protein